MLKYMSMPNNCWGMDLPDFFLQVMAEGELLSKKQLAQESTMKKLRQHVKDAELSRQELAANLTLERQRLEQMQTAKQKLEADLAAAKHAHRVEVETERAHYEGLLAKSRSAQVCSAAPCFETEVINLGSILRSFKAEVSPPCTHYSGMSQAHQHGFYFSLGSLYWVAFIGSNCYPKPLPRNGLGLRSIWFAKKGNEVF